jgi:hypothetical protein
MGMSPQSVMEPEALVPVKFSEKRHTVSIRRHSYPQPHKYYFDFELDRVFRRCLKGKGKKKSLNCAAAVPYGCHISEKNLDFKYSAPY